MRLLHGGRAQQQRCVAVARHETFITVSEAVNPVHAVLQMAAHHDAANDVVQTGAQTAAGDDAHRRPRRIKVDHLTRSGLLVARRGHIASVFQKMAVIQDAIGVRVFEWSLHSADAVQRGVKTTWAERANARIWRGRGHGWCLSLSRSNASRDAVMRHSLVRAFDEPFCFRRCAIRAFIAWL